MSQRRTAPRYWEEPNPFEISAGKGDTIKAVLNGRAWLLARNHETASYIEVRAVELSVKERRLTLVGRRDGEAEARFIPVKGLEILGSAPLLRQASRELLWGNGYDYRPLTR